MTQITQDNFDNEYQDIIEMERIDKFVSDEMDRQMHRYIKAFHGSKDIMDKFVAANQTAYTKLIKEYAYPRFEQDPTRKQSLWDAQVPGIFLSPDLISSTDVRQIAMVTDLGYSYGESVAWKNDLGPAASTYCTVVYDVHGEEYWNFVVDLLSTEF